MSDHYEERRARRERIATACLAGLLANGANGAGNVSTDCDIARHRDAVVWSVVYADALMAALDAPTTVRHLPTGGAE